MSGTLERVSVSLRVDLDLVSEYGDVQVTDPNTMRVESRSGSSLVLTRKGPNEVHVKGSFELELELDEVFVRVPDDAYVGSYVDRDDGYRIDVSSTDRNGATLEVATPGGQKLHAATLAWGSYPLATDSFKLARGCEVFVLFGTSKYDGTKRASLIWSARHAGCP